MNIQKNTRNLWSPGPESTPPYTKMAMFVLEQSEACDKLPVSVVWYRISLSLLIAEIPIIYIYIYIYTYYDICLEITVDKNARIDPNHCVFMTILFQTCPESLNYEFLLFFLVGFAIFKLF